MPLSLKSIRPQFPILQEQFDGQPLVYLDNAATTQKPQAVLDAMDQYYRHNNANINRGVHILGERATVAYEKARKTVQTFINAKHSHEIIFTRNATEAINLVAKTWGRHFLEKDDAIALSIMEHHSNIVPWLQLKDENDIRLDWISVDAEGEIVLEDLEKSLASEKTKLVAITGLSNVLGTLTPLKKIIEMAHAAGALVLVDASQLIRHVVIDIQDLDADFLACTGHKLYGPTGIGVLYGKTDLLENMPPFLGGGDMIGEVTKDGFTVAELPRKFEAGTPAIAQAIGLAAAIDWITQTGRDDLATHEDHVLAYAYQQLQTIKNIHLIGPTDPANRKGCISFTLDDIHPHDLTEILGRQGICLRAGHHCTQPLHEYLKLTATTRLSVAAYNTKEEIDVCVAAILKARTKLLS